MSTPTMGDYQTAKRMADKLRALPPIEWAGRTVLDVGCDHGAWSKLASDGGASRVVGLDRGRGVRNGGRIEFVDLPALNNARGWANCEFRHFNLGEEWTDFGRFDIVLFLSVYHHVYGETGDHDRIWRWLWQHTCRDGGYLLWEGPVDTRDNIARQRAQKHGNYTRQAILGAASRYFTVEPVGPAIHRPHREVWKCTPHQEPKDDPRDGHERVRRGRAGVPGAADARDGGAVRVAAPPRNAERAGKKPCRECGKSGRAGRVDGARQQNRAAPVVEGTPRRRRKAAPPVPAGPGPEVQSSVSGAGFVGPLEVHGIGEWRSGPPDTSTALVLGGAQCVWEDVRALEAEFGTWQGLVIAVNDVGCHWPGPVDHWVTLHPEKMAKWKADRSSRGHPAGYVTWTSRKHTNCERVISTWGGGSSGMLAVTVAIDGLKVHRVVLAGVPMEKTPHFKESTVHQPTKPWNSAQTHWRAWGKAPVQAKMAGKVRSMSGRTRDTFGAPDAEWLGIERRAA